VVSISACHSKEQLAGGRGSIPRQRDNTILFFPSFSWWSGGRWTSFGEDWSVRPAVLFLRENDSIAWDGEMGLVFSRMILGHGQGDNGCSL
jgi:hypothetical protein